jgi:hypothetical protein
LFTGSIAAAIQGPSVAAGSAFAICQSIGATGLVPAVWVAAGGAIGGAAAAGTAAAGHTCEDNSDDSCNECNGCKARAD